ncbi:maleylpyruvate isomerase family mycothiol-dependent enzyme [Nonomuraea gerenzanensis]|uniref:LmbV protein n=1 Tax=Nonomuraea gerenzanensis TaxID=93944 RepID=A0A1M4E1T7_9ACTN|nr:maleylpyruvate isomerase family mycothiol-dependent enzyme [Nonomuraea gerenzanensis]UBU15038.1 maleylpyruvate isomerase family mycothiol-dependent enzyme [Nonomuraea gerenzanensis]SBO92781.1 LmbV protein [Nonomuraea gerenzanensis]
MAHDLLKDFNPFDLFDAEAARLDRFFTSLDDAGWRRPSRCAGWSVRDVLAHLAGEELYNHACLDGTVQDLMGGLADQGIGDYNDFNEWSVRRRADLPVEEVLAEWRTQNGETRERMRALGEHAMLDTMAGPYPVGLQAFHYDSEYATHADDVGAPVAEDEADERTLWRVAVGRFVLAEQDAKVQVDQTAEQIFAAVDGVTATLSYPEFVEATVGRLPASHDLDPRIASSLRCLA